MSGDDAYRNAYLRSAHWLAFKARYKREKTWKCAIPGCETRNLDLHHLTYKRIGQEEPGDCVPLCRKHHTMTHALVDAGISLRRAHLQVAMTEGGRKMRVVVLPEASKSAMIQTHIARKRKHNLRKEKRGNWEN